MGLFSFGSKKLPINKTLKLKRLKTSFDVKEGQNLKLWLDTKKGVVNVYAKGSGGGRGLLATIDDYGIYKAINKYDPDIKTEVLTVNDTSFDLKINLI